jgi:hypothetical protein
VKVISPIFGSMSGKLGGAVGATSRGGVQYFRKLVKPGNPRSLAQTTVRLVQTALAAAWKSTLTDLQRSGWEGIAPATSSGIDAFVKGNMQPLIAGLARTDDAPDSLALVTEPITAMVVDASDHSITPTGGGPAGAGPTATVSFNLYVSAPQSSSRLSRQHPYQFAGLMQLGDTSVTIPTANPAYNLVAGDIVYVRVVQFHEPGGIGAGQVATAQEFRVTVQA